MSGLVCQVLPVLRPSNLLGVIRRVLGGWAPG